jgi:Domain of unknown function (DUF4124)
MSAPFEWRFSEAGGDGNLYCSPHCMMGPRIVKTVCAAVAALVLGAAPAVQAVMYKWIDENGTVTYSNHLPPDWSGIKEITLIEEPAPPPPADMRKPEVTVVHPEPAAPRREAETIPQPIVGAEREAPRRVTPRSTSTLAVQDPCLTSSDRTCHQKNSGDYHPYLGYSPGAGTPPATGATRAAGAGGVVAGAGGAPPAGAYIPPRRAQTEARSVMQKPQWK